VEFVKDLREDVKRRDFTINAMAYNDKNGLQDYFGGIEDLKAGVIRCVGDANERFNEDALRILRAMRFAATFDFEIDEGTANAMHSNKSLLSYISKERISVELMKLLKGSGAARILREFADIVTEIIPEIAPCIGLEQNKIYHKFDVWEHTLSAIDNAERDSIIRLAVLLHDIGKPECYAETETGIHFYGHPETGASIADEILHRLKMSNDIISTVCTLVKYHASYLGITSGGLKRLLNKIGIENARLLLKVAYADMSAHSDGAMIETRASLEFVKSELDRIEENNECFKVTQLAVNGKDMIALGFKGQEIGEKLNMLLEAVIDGKAENERDALIAFLKK
jgi:tRNA nucleotidyltransferase (CCA-adding enzyme)